MKHLIDPMDLSMQELDGILHRAQDIMANPDKYSEICKGKKIATLFYEPSTRTRLSFEAAMIELGGQVLGFSEASSSSVSKGESVEDTVRVVGCFADVIAMRHMNEGAPMLASNHPTQTLTDLLTIFSEKGRLDNFTIGLCGDLKFGRTVHSLIKALSRYKGVKFVLISPEELKVPDYIISEVLEPAGLDYKEVTSLEESMPELDILYMTRVQRERFFNEADYVRLKDTYILDTQKMELAKDDMIVLHPLPRVNEIATSVDKDPRALYFKQVLYGKYVREALILHLLGL